MIVNQRELAEAFRVSPRTIRRWERDGLDVARTPDGYDLTEAIAWRVADLEDDQGDEFAEARTRRMRALAHRSELLAAEEEGELVRMEHLEEVVGKLVDAIRGAVSQIPGSWGPRLVGISDPAEGTQAMQGVAEDIFRALQSAADELELEVEGGG